MSPFSIIVLLIAWACGYRVWKTMRAGKVTFGPTVAFTRERSPTAFWLIVGLEAFPILLAAYMLVLMNLQRT